jgi:hypothetical protein
MGWRNSSEVRQSVHSLLNQRDPQNPRAHLHDLKEINKLLALYYTQVRFCPNSHASPLERRSKKPSENSCCARRASISAVWTMAKTRWTVHVGGCSWQQVQLGFGFFYLYSGDRDKAKSYFRMARQRKAYEIIAHIGTCLNVCP